MLTTYPFRVVDDNGALVPGATLTQSALVNLASGTAIPAVVPVVVDLGGGDYSTTYDADAHPEALLQLVPTKAGTVFTGQNALLPIVLGRTVLAATGMDALLTDIANDADMRSTGMKMLRGIFNWMANKVTCTSTTQTLNNDAGTAIITMPVSDDGTTATKARSQ